MSSATPLAGSAPLSYAVITVVKDEEPFIPRTIASMVAQRHRPEAWLIVDDGSSDRTPEILEAAAAEHAWIRVFHGKGRPDRNPSFATAEGFNWVLPHVWDLPVEAVVKLDGDMEFDGEYFARLLGEMGADPRLGIVGGRALEPHKDGSWGMVQISAHHVHGATQVFRREVLAKQGGLTLGIGEDTVTIIRARLDGWTTRSLPDVAFYHLRVTGSAGGRLRAQRAKGRAAYRVGYHPLFGLLRGFRNMVRRPFVLSGFAFWQGFFGGYTERAPRALEPEEIRAFRREQIRALTGRRSWWR